MPGPTLIVLAAGIGSRYGGLKQLDGVGPHGELIIDYSVYDALQAGFGRVVFVINQAIEAAFRDRVGKKIENHCETVYVRQSLDDVPAGFQVPPNRHKPWGTAHAALSCKDVVHSPFAVINADDLYGRSAYQALHDYLAGARDRAGVYDYCMVGYLLENTLTEHGHVARGVCVVDRDGFLVEVRERTRIRMAGDGAQYSEDGEHWVDIPKGSIASLNTWGFTPSFFAELEVRFAQFLARNRDTIEKAEYFLPNVVGELIKEQKARVRVLPTNERWFGVTYQQDKPRVKQAIKALIRRGVYPENLWGDA
jgi:Nucleotidyl transferase